MKIYNRTKQTKGKRAMQLRRALFSVTAILAVSVLIISPRTLADIYDSQINGLMQQNSGTQSAISNLQVQEASLADQVAGLQTQISALQAQITANTTKQNDLAAKIAAAQAELDKQRKILGADIKQMYLESSVTTLEMLASSQDLSSFFDKSAYRETVQSKIKSTLDTVNLLKAQLQDQKTTVDKLIADQSTMQGQLTAQQNQVAYLLNLNQGQQNAYEQNIKTNNDKISELRRQQAIENAKNFIGSWKTGGTGGYPWANAPWPNSISDPWGMYLRQCVSYTAWRVAASGRYMPFWGGIGNANQWDDNARAAGIPTDTNPRIGDVAISNAGYYGHAMYVEAVNGDGTITISQYNAGWDGVYSIGRRSTAGLVFIHF